MQFPSEKVGGKVGKKTARKALQINGLRERQQGEKQGKTAYAAMTGAKYLCFHSNKKSAKP